MQTVLCSFILFGSYHLMPRKKRTEKKRSLLVRFNYHTKPMCCLSDFQLDMLRFMCANFPILESVEKRNLTRRSVDEWRHILLGHGTKYLGLVISKFRVSITKSIHRFYKTVKSSKLPLNDFGFTCKSETTLIAAMTLKRAASSSLRQHEICDHTRSEGDAER